jgi:hypothetical protein
LGQHVSTLVSSYSKAISFKIVHWKKGFYNVEVKVAKYDEFINIIKDKKMFCKICKKKLFTAVTTNFGIDESVELKTIKRFF